jgi:hypothetical protein
VRLRAAAANAAWVLSASPEERRFRSNLHRVGKVQEEILRGITGMRSVAEFRDRYAIRSWDEQQLVLREPVERWEETSGSSGAKKRIPYTRTLRRQFNAAIAPWIVSLFREDPPAFAGEAYWSISPGAASDEELLGPLQRRLVRAVQAVPSSVRLAADLEAFRRDTLDALRRCRTLSLISVWHPSFLELIVGADVDTEATWPHLRVISCWADANAAGAAASLAKRFPHARIQPKGLLSTEGFVTIPYDGAPTLAYRSHFFEFRDGDDVRLATEVEVGRRYGVVLTTGGGLYRYDTEDIVEVTGFRQTCPLLRFVGRAQHVSDHFGEKLNEIFVRERMDAALRPVPHAFAMLACESNTYVLFVESAAADAVLSEATASLEESLREAFHYDHCRRLGQLQPLRFVRVHEGAATYLRAKSATQTLGAIKIPALDREQGWEGRFSAARYAR